VPQNVQNCYEVINAFQQQAYIEPILAVVEISPRQDLAETANDLVALNIFKKRIMADDPTVGGAIDVAVISRDTGFTWFKRQGG
jgi:dihydroxyacetone kinase DhaKLM complex PTS-EIIA-like component DhaM